MSVEDKEWWLLLAGEYVLGTLRGAERDLFEKVIHRDPQAGADVAYWEQKLGDLEIDLQEIEAGVDTVDKELIALVWKNIVTQLEIERANASAAASVRQHENEKSVANTVASRKMVAGRDADGESDLIPAPIRLRRWKLLAGLATAAALAMAYIGTQQWLRQPVVDDVTVVNETTQPQTRYNIISVLPSEDGADLWAVIADSESGHVQVVALEPPPASVEYSYQLWIVLPDDTGVQAVGLLPDGNGTSEQFTLTDKQQADALSAGAAFAVSREPAGGSPGNAPTGPVISSQSYTRFDNEL